MFGPNVNWLHTQRRIVHADSSLCAITHLRDLPDLPVDSRGGKMGWLRSVSALSIVGTGLSWAHSFVCRPSSRRMHG